MEEAITCSQSVFQLQVPTDETITITQSNNSILGELVEGTMYLTYVLQI